MRVFMILWVVKIVILVLMGLAAFKASRAKQLDSTIEFKLNLRSWLELLVIVGLNIFVLISRPGSENEILYIFLGQLMIILTFLHTKRYVFAGKKYLYMIENVFDEKEIRNMNYTNGVLHLKIRKTATKVRLPITDVEYLLERFSGKKYQN